MRKQNNLWQVFPALILGLLFFAPCVLTQTFKATIVGQVADSNGAAVPNATVTITQITTNQSQSVTTDGEGNYVIAQLDPANYTVKVEAANFKTLIRTNLVLETNQSLRLNLTLEAGNITEQVTVSTDPPALNTETSEKGEVITPRQVQDLPLNGRNFTDLALLAPGVYRRPADDDQGEGLAAAGTRTDASNFILDGTVNRSDRNASVGVNTSVDSIREFKVQTSTYSAEFGRTAGAQINVVSKSGTNRFSGSLFEYLRNDIFDAQNPFTEPGADKKLRRNQFGGTLGGPFPFLNFGEGVPVFSKGSSFFFVSYEGTRERRSQSEPTNAPRAEWLRGDFRGVRSGRDRIPGNSDDVIIRCINNLGQRVECPTPNVIPLTNVPGPGGTTILGINPLSQSLLRYIPAANNASSSDPFDTSHLATLNEKTDRDQFLVKIDHKINDKNNAFVRYSKEWGEGFDPFPSSRNFYPGFGRDTIRNQNNFVASNTTIFSTNLVNEARFGIFWQKNENLGENRTTDFVTQFGLQNFLPTATQSVFQGFPAIRIDGFSEFGDRPNDPFVYNLRNYQFFDSLSAIIGNHSLKFGVDIIRSQYNEADVRNVRGDFRFRGRNTNQSGATRSGEGSFADFLYGLPDATQRQIGADPAHLSGWQYAFFIQDDWRVTNWLTLNLGVRYELQTPLTERDNRLSNFIPELQRNVCPTEQRDPLNGSLICVAAESVGLPSKLIETDKNNFAPRVGFALRPFRDDKTVIRGGAGIYYSLETFNPIRQQLANAYPFIVRQQFSRNSSQILALSWQNPTRSTSGSLQGIDTPFGLQVDYKVPEIYQYNLTLERELLPDLALEVGYVGSQGRFLGIRYNLNSPLPTGTINQTTGLPNTVRRFTSLGDIQFQEQIAVSNYNALQTTLRRRSKGGLTLLASYTFSKAMDTASSTNNSTTGTQKFPQDIRNLRLERGLSDFHRKHQFSGSVNYELPFGKGRRFFNEASGLTDFFIGGWQFNAIVTMLSGRPFTPQFNAPDVAQQRPDIIGDPYNNVPAGYAFNPAAFAEPVARPSDPDLFGNAGRNILIGAAFNSTDLSLTKNFRLTERAKIQFRAEAFNIFNNVNYRTVGFLLDRNDAGEYLGTSTEMREFQFAVKLLF